MGLGAIPAARISMALGGNVHPSSGNSSGREGSGVGGGGVSGGP